jgi:Tfp pilus assembly pilus retraction ATPase PilT
MEQNGDTMMLMEVSLKNLYEEGRIDVKTALTYAPDQVRMKQLIGYAD